MFSKFAPLVFKASDFANFYRFLPFFALSLLPIIFLYYVLNLLFAPIESEALLTVLV